MFISFRLVLFLFVGSVAFHLIPGDEYFSVLFSRNFFCWEFIVDSSYWIVSTKWWNLKWPWEPIVCNLHFYFEWFLKIKYGQMHPFVFELSCDYHFTFLNKLCTRHTIPTYNKILMSLNYIYLNDSTFGYRTKPKIKPTVGNLHKYI